MSANMSVGQEVDSKATNRVLLNDKSIRRPAPKTGRTEVWDTILPGFGLRIAAGGSRTYVLMKRVNGKLVRRTVGHAPPPNAAKGERLPVGCLWPAEAREEARRIAAAMAVGEDVAAPRRKPRRAPKGETSQPDEAGPIRDSFLDVAQRYLADPLRGGGANLASRAELERKLKVDLAQWHDRPITDVRGRDIRELVREKATHSPVAANRLLAFIKVVFKWATVQEIVDADPAAGVPKPVTEQPRERFLSEREIGLVWKAADKLPEPVGRIYKLALLTGQRRANIAGLLRSEVGTLTFKARDSHKGREASKEAPALLFEAGRMKRRKPHAVPLSPMALSVIDGAPMLKDKDGKPFEHVFARAEAGDKALQDWSGYKAAIDAEIGRLIAKETGEEYDPARHRLEPWTLHDLRATLATHMRASLDVPEAVVSRILHHAQGDGRSMTAKYIRHAYDAEAAEALNRWADMVARLGGMNVVQLANDRAS